MSTPSIRLPESLHHSLRELSKNDNVSINPFVSTAGAEKIAAMETERYLDARAKSGSEHAFKASLAKVRDRKPDPNDS